MSGACAGDNLPSRYVHLPGAEIAAVQPRSQLARHCTPRNSSTGASCTESRRAIASCSRLPGGTPSAGRSHPASQVLQTCRIGRVFDTATPFHARNRAAMGRRPPCGIVPKGRCRKASPPPVHPARHRGQTRMAGLLACGSDASRRPSRSRLATGPVAWWRMLSAYSCGGSLGFGFPLTDVPFSPSAWKDHPIRGISRPPACPSKVM